MIIILYHNVIGHYKLHPISFIFFIRFFQEHQEIIYEILSELYNISNIDNMKMKFINLLIKR